MVYEYLVNQLMKFSVDVSATNDSTRDVNKIQLDLVRHVAFYKSAAACSAFQSLDRRVPARLASKSVASNVLKIESEKSDNAEWRGIRAGSRETLVCQIGVPADELSISAGRYFETRYMIRIMVCTKGGDVDLELPITIVHVQNSPTLVCAVLIILDQFPRCHPVDGQICFEDDCNVCNTGKQ